MASGFGISGHVGRCFPAWTDFQKCMLEAEDPFRECGAYREDYFECLHHKKEYQRLNTIMRHAEKRIEQIKAQEKEGGGKKGGH